MGLKYVISVILFCVSSVWAQTVSLPTTWVNNTEYIGTTTNTINYPSVGTGGSWTCAANSTTYGPYTADTSSSLQTAINNAETCRTAGGTGTLINIPAGHLFSNAIGLTLPQTATDTSTNFIVLNSTRPLPIGRPVCSHGIQDNLSTSTQPGIRNLGCNGSNMSYQLGTTVTPVSGAFTLANGVSTNTSNYNDVSSMFTLQCTQSGCNELSTAPADVNNVGPHHYAILNVEMHPLAGVSAANAVIKIGQGNTETLVSQIPTHIHFAYSYFHSDWTDAPVSGGSATGGPTGANSIPHAINLTCINCSIAYSYFDRLLRPGAEGHDIYLGFAQKIKVVHNWVEGQAIGLLTGGYTHTISLAGVSFIDGQDVEDRGNRYTYPYSWILAATAGFCANNQPCAGNGYSRKNAHETKVAERYLMDGNILENVDSSGGQSGISNSWKTSNAQTLGSQNYFMVNRDLTFTNNIMRNSCEDGSWGYRSSITDGNGDGVTLPTQLALWQNNLVYNVSVTIPGCVGVSPAMGFRVNTTNGSFENISTVAGSCSRTSNVSSCTTSQPTGLTIGDPVQIAGCADTSFNSSPTAMGPTIVSPTVYNGTTVAWANSGPDTTTSGCTVNSRQGWPRYLIFNHNTEIIGGTKATSPYSTGTATIYALARNMTFTNNIGVGGGVNGSTGEGISTQTRGFDGATLLYHHDAYPNRDGLVTCTGHNTPSAGGIAACYGEYATIGVQTVPTTILGTQTPNCTGAATSSCIGFVGGLSTASLSINLSDYHGYALDSGSSFKAGGAFQASDSTDLGANIANLDTAQVSTLYVCATACGGGPFSDNIPLVTDLVASPASVTFSNQQVSVSSAGVNITATNTTAGVITISSIALTSGTQFSIFSNTCGGTLAGSATCVVTIKFTPTSIGSKSDSLVFTDSGASSPQSVSLGGTGISIIGQPQTQDTFLIMPSLWF